MSHSVCPSVCLSVCLSVPLSLPSITSRHLANYNDTHVLFGRAISAAQILVLFIFLFVVLFSLPSGEIKMNIQIYRTLQWRREGFFRPGQRSLVPPLQPATPILSASAPCKLTVSSYLFARWHLFWHAGYLRHQQQVDL